VAGRALVFSDPTVVHLLKTRFVPYAGDQWYLHRRQDAQGQFFWKVAQQGHNRSLPEDSTRQGIYAAGPDGTLLGSINSWSAEKTVAMLHTAIERWQQQPRSGLTEVAASAADPEYTRQPPAGGLILNVFSRIPLKPTEGEAWTLNQGHGRDHMWLTREEWRSLLPSDWRAGMRYPVPRAVTQRLLRFHLVDNVRGEPPMWRPEEIRQADLWLRVEETATGRLRLEGTARMNSEAPDRAAASRGYEARLQGYLAYDRKADRFARFDLLAWGEAWGEGPYTGGAPKGHFPLLIAASVAGAAPADRVPPQASRELADYFGTR
jgi:hypothetical protein